MKKIFLLGVLIFGILTIGKAQNELAGTCILKINLSKLSNKHVKIYLSYKLASTVVIKDTLFAIGNFIKVTKKLDEPCLAMLSLNPQDDIDYLGDYHLKKGVFSFFLQPGVLTINGGLNLSSSVISNTLLQKEYRIVREREKLASEKITIVNKIYGQLIGKRDTGAAMQKLSDIGKIRESLIGYYKSCVVSEALQSMIKLYVLQQYFSYGRDLYDPNDTERTNTADSLFNVLDPALKISPSAIALKSQLNILKAIQIGKVAPDFMAQDSSDNTIILSSLHGKYVLIDFWASWCGSCRAQFPALKKVYQEFKSKKFEIIGVAIDEKNRWKDAVKQDNTRWLQVLDDTYSTRSPSLLYHISPIPMNFLIDPEGKIIASNLSPVQVRQKLKELIIK